MGSNTTPPKTLYFNISQDQVGTPLCPVLNSEDTNIASADCGTLLSNSDGSPNEDYALICDMSKGNQMSILLVDPEEVAEPEWIVLRSTENLVNDEVWVLA